MLNHVIERVGQKQIIIYAKSTQSTSIPETISKPGKPKMCVNGIIG